MDVMFTDVVAVVGMAVVGDGVVDISTKIKRKK